MRLPVEIHVDGQESVRIGVIEIPDDIGFAQATQELGVQMSGILGTFKADWDELVLGEV